MHSKNNAKRADIGFKKHLHVNYSKVNCERHGEIVATDINYALTADKLYKGMEVAPEVLASFTKEELDGMKALGDERRADMKRLYDIAEKINL